MLLYCLCLITSYSLAYVFLKNKYWDIFTRIISTLNALQCTYLFLSNLTNTKMFDLLYVASPSSLSSLYYFSFYLLIDGVFLIPFLKPFSIQNTLSLLHHLVGSLGIYLIASNRKGFFLGFYFSLTEISTPLLNLSWFFRHPRLLITFYLFFFIFRILTVPILLFYLHINESLIAQLSPLNYYMTYYGSYTLILLNVTWFVLITKKIKELREIKRS